MQAQCTTPDCLKPVHGRGLCNTHYMWAHRHGLTEALPHQRHSPPRRYTDEQRLRVFWSRVDPCRTDGCAIWLGGHNPDGYGGFVFEGGTLAHHYLVGKPGPGMEWDHVRAWGCTHRDCVWPGHLELVTKAENTRRGRNAMRDKTHCPWGHEYDEANTRIDKRGARICRACKRLWKRKPRTLTLTDLAPQWGG